MKIFIPLLVLFFLLILTQTCERRIPGQSQLGKLERIEISDVTGIPQEYGILISVTPVIDYPGFVQLWFQDSLGTIRMVRVGFTENKVYNEALVIPRY